MLQPLTQLLAAGRSLDREQVAGAVRDLVAEAVSPEEKASFLAALAAKGETADELGSFALELRELSLQPPLDAGTRARVILDVCGTGGDRLNTFNISTTVALLAASAGITVAKHGNRAVTSRSGSADVLEELGIRIDLTPEESAERLRDHHFAFFFAQRFHPAFKNIAPARRLCAERGQRTIFNLLGPLLNPARPGAQLIGVPRPEWCEPVGKVLQAIGVRRGMIVSGTVPIPGAGPAFLDELSTLGETTVAEFYQDRGFASSRLEPHHFPLQRATLADLAGGDRKTNAAILRRILGGEERGPKRDAVLLNAAAALFVAGHSRSMVEGWEEAARLIDSGAASGKLKALAG